MSFEPSSILFNILPLALGILAVNILVLAVVVFFSVSLLKRMLVLQDESKKKKEEAERAAEEIVDRAREEAWSFSEEAGKKSAEFLESMKSFRTRAENELDKILSEFLAGEQKRLHGVSAELLQSYQALGQKAYKSYESELERSLKLVREGAAHEIVNFERLLREEIIQYQKVLTDETRGWNEKVKQEVEDYKKRAFERVDQSIFEVLAHVSKEVLGRALSLEDHKDFVIQALEEAKRSGFFTPLEKNSGAGKSM